MCKILPHIRTISCADLDAFCLLASSELHPPPPVMHLQTGPVGGSSIDTLIQA